MRSFLSAMVLAAFFALLVPDNGTQASNAAVGSGVSVASVGSAPVAAPAAPERDGDHEAPVDSEAAMLLALGFLGAVMARRLRAD